MKNNAVAIVIKSYGKILSISRFGDYDDKGLIAGYIDDGETPLQAIIRETFEEANIRIEEKSIIELGTISDNDKKITVYYTIAYEVLGLPNEEEGIVRWVGWQSLLDGTFGEINKEIRALVRAYEVSTLFQSENQDKPVFYIEIHDGFHEKFENDPALFLKNDLWKLTGSLPLFRPIMDIPPEAYPGQTCAAKVGNTFYAFEIYEADPIVEKPIILHDTLYRNIRKLTHEEISTLNLVKHVRYYNG